MIHGKRFVLILGLVGLLALPAEAVAEHYTMEFIPTQNAPPGARGTMSINVLPNGETNVRFSVSGVYPDTVYTIWIVYNTLTWTPDDPNNVNTTSISSSPASKRLGFPPEANGVAPLARLDAAFTSGMGLDPGASFVTDDKGKGEIDVKLDYDLLREAPVANKDLIGQCAPAVAADGTCPPPGKVIRITTAWLRRFIGEFPLAERVSMCANYDPTYDPDVTPDSKVRKGMDVRLWQCIDPATLKNPGDPWSGLPRVHRYEFDHFRLANHPDDLTHGFIGGNGFDHWIDMVGRRADLLGTQGLSASAINSGSKVK